MQELTFVTTNELKFRMAKITCESFGISLVQAPDIEIVEIQDEMGEPIARHKANEAFQKLQKPIAVTDDSWIIPGLKGFPGPYMKSVNTWFTSDDWLRLTRDLEDRRVFLRQIIVYQDELEQVLMSVDIEGVLLKEIRGSAAKNGNQPVMSMDGGKHSIAEIFARGESALKSRHTAWHELAVWLQEKRS